MGDQKRSAPRGLKRKRDEEEDECTLLDREVAQLDLLNEEHPKTFTELPLSKRTRSSLEASYFKTLTSIQAKAIPTALKGSDVLGAAKTGSGKTLAFLIPVLENLYRKRWTDEDGLGALILSPTRELAVQIFEVLRKVGRNHTFSAGIVIGGNNRKEEREQIGRMNILVATPGRMLQHMDQTPDLSMGNLQMLVLDEADRIMDMGFKNAVDAMIEHLPLERQTLMFSATQTKRVSDLARLSLRNPEFVAVHETADSATPSTLQQNYVLTPLPDKIDTLWSFVRANLKKKILVFLSSGKQVRFVYESLRRLQPGISLLHLHGRQKQTARLDITKKFSNSQHACLFATDVVARGLDFPAVDWVVQADCPEDAETYIHRVGRTARYEHDGRAVLLLDPSEEEGMLKALERKKVMLEKITVKQKKMQNTIRTQLQNMCLKDPELKYLGQKAFSTYVRSVHLQKDKDIFKVKELDLEQFAASLGLPGAPRVKYVKGDDAKSRKNRSRQLLEASSGSEDDISKGEKKNIVRTKHDRLFERRNQDILADHYANMKDDESRLQTNGHGVREETDEENDFLAIKNRKTPPEPEKANGFTHRTVQLSDKQGDVLVVDSKRREKLLSSKKKLAKYKAPGSHTFFDEDGISHEKVYYEEEQNFAKKGRPEDQRKRFLEGERPKTMAADVDDKAEAKRKRMLKKEKRKAREREQAEFEDAEGPVATLAPYEEEREKTNEPQPKKRQKKWFEDASSDDEQTGKIDNRRKNMQQRFDADDKPETLEDLEALASGLLAA